MPAGGEIVANIDGLPRQCGLCRRGLRHLAGPSGLSVCAILFSVGAQGVGMRRRSKASGKAKARGKAAPPKRRRSPVSGATSEAARLARALDEVHEQQQATADVLRLISGSTGDLEPVFATILANAVRLCDADNGAINRFES